MFQPGEWESIRTLRRNIGSYKGNFRGREKRKKGCIKHQSTLLAAATPVCCGATVGDVPFEDQALGIYPTPQAIQANSPE
ncbi:MAG: hypothetical protein JWR09_596 [Mucilaginibacter sp.]|nr:hypothetical protein [Mucilaginibacter sp.]